MVEPPLSPSSRLPTRSRRSPNVPAVSGRSFQFGLAVLTLARLILNSGTRFVYPFLPAIARGLGVPLEQAGLLVSVRWTSGMATPFVTAQVGKESHYRRQVIMGLGLFAAGAAVTVTFGTFTGALFGFAAMGLAKPTFDVAAQAYLAHRVEYNRRARTLGVFEATWAGGFLVGAPIAGWLIDWGGWETPFWVFSAALGLAALLAFGSMELEAGKQAARQKLVWNRPAIGLALVMSLFAAGAEILFVVFGIWLETAFGLSLVALGGTAILIGLAELAGESGTIAITDRLGKRRALVSGLSVAAVGYLLLIPGENNLVLGLAALAIGLAGFEFAILSSVPLQTEIRPKARAQFLSWTVLSMAVFRAIGAAIGTPLYNEVGLAGNAIVATIVNVAAIAVLLAWVKEPD